MSDKAVGFLEIADRLKLALDLQSELQLAARLGFKQSAWSTRKTRGSLPSREIDALIIEESLNPEFIYHGIGSVHLDVDSQSWEVGFNKRLAQILCIQTYCRVLMHEGYKAPYLKSIVENKSEPSAKLLRDMHRCLKLDLNWLMCGDIESAQTSLETSLLSAYRKADKQGQEFIRRAAGLASK